MSVAERIAMIAEFFAKLIIYLKNLFGAFRKNDDNDDGDGDED